MTSEREIREIAAAEAREALARHTALWENHPHLSEDEWSRCADMIATYPIPDLPVPDRDGCLWPLHGRNYGHVRLGAWGYPHPDPTTPCITIARGGPGKASSITPMHLTPQEALELASLLTAAAQEEA